MLRNLNKLGREVHFKQLTAFREVRIFHEYIWSQDIDTTYLYNRKQGMSCEGACAHAHVRCVVARVRVRAKSILESVRDVRACGLFWT